MTQSVAIVGGGMVGLSFGLAIKRALPLASVTLLEASPMPDGIPNPLDSRASALNLSSVSILSGLSVADVLRPHRAVIKQVHVSNQRRFGSTLMRAEDLGETDLGWVIENHHIGRALQTQAEALGVVLKAPCQVTGVLRGPQPGLRFSDGSVVNADLVIVADGAHSTLRAQLGIGFDTLDSGQVALVANCAFEGDQQGIAFERFTPEGPLALLPLPSTERGQQRFNMVWSMAATRVETLSAQSDSELLTAIQRAFGWRLGRVLKVGKRSRWPLVRVRAQEQVRSGFLIAGNAAHGLHPVAGQGFNLSLRDAAALASVLSSASAQAESIGSLATLRRYEALVGPDQSRTTFATDTLATLFNTRGWLLDLPRDAALASLDLLPPLRQWVARQGTTPAIAETVS